MHRNVEYKYNLIFHGPFAKALLGASTLSRLERKRENWVVAKSVKFGTFTLDLDTSNGKK